MALLQSELVRLKAELGYGVLTNSAAAYVQTTALFEQVVAVYLTGGAVTTATTTVAAADTPTPVTLTLASATGFAAGALVYVDVDARQESATVQAVSGSTITLLLSLAHGPGSYPVTVEGGEAIVREILGRLRALGGAGVATGAAVAEATGSGGVKKVDEVEFFGTTEASTAAFTSLQKQRMYWRDELASVLGVQNLWRVRQGQGGAVSLY